MKSYKSLALAALFGALMAGTALAAEVKSIAILTPEEGTDYGWNQQGVDAAKAAAKATGVEVVVAQGLGYGDVRPTMRELATDGASLLIAQGVPLKVISELLGHSSIRITADVYGHLLEPSKAEAADAMETAL